MLSVQSKQPPSFPGRRGGGCRLKSNTESDTLCAENIPNPKFTRETRDSSEQTADTETDSVSGAPGAPAAAPRGRAAQ